MGYETSNSNNQWNLILEESLDIKKLNINTFRQIGKENCRLGTWDAIDKSSRYFKSLLYSNAENLDRKILTNSPLIEKHRNGEGLRHYLKKIRNQYIGNPPTINFFNNKLSIDYLSSVEEMFFLDDILNKSEVVLEIGAGFGRLTHSIIQNFENINRYIIVDLDEVLELAKTYLKKVLNKKEFQKIDFISNRKIKQLQEKNKIDLSINIDSFQEIEESIVLDYLEFVSEYSTYFYSKNAIGKYDPELVDIQNKNDSQINSALNMGLCKDIIDIFDSNEIQKARLVYLEKFCPKDFIISKHDECFGQYLYYYSALYKQNKFL